MVSGPDCRGVASGTLFRHLHTLPWSSYSGVLLPFTHPEQDRYASEPAAPMSFELDGGALVLPVAEFLKLHDDEKFVWDKDGEEQSPEWIKPVEEAGLDLRRHKVFHHANKEYTMQPLPFQHDGELGDSGSTIVYRVRAPKGHPYRRPLALKVIVCKERARAPGPDSNARRSALREVRNMSAIRHPHIVVYVASFEDYCLQTKRLEITRGRSPRPRQVFHTSQQAISKHILGIAMYPPAQCNLQTFMHECVAWCRNPSQRSTESSQAQSQSQSQPQSFSQSQGDDEGWWKIPYMHTYFGCLAQAVAYLHRSSVRIRHKDIKPENIVIDQFGQPVLTDFGLSKHFETGQHSDGPTGKTLKYADPEAMHETTRDERSDIFSLGCVYLEMATVLLGRQPRFAEEFLGGYEPQLHGDFKYSEALSGLNDYLAELARSVPSGNNINDNDENTDEQEEEDDNDDAPAPALADKSPSRRQTSRKAVTDILPVIAHMMHGDFDQRPYAHELYPLFRPLCECQNSPGLCPTCEEERETGGLAPRTGSQRSGRTSPTMVRSPTVGSMMMRRTSLLQAHQHQHQHQQHQQQAAQPSADDGHAT